MTGAKNRLQSNAITQAASTIGRGFLDLLYPPVCVHCQSRTSSGTPLCRRCRRRLEPVPHESLRRLLDRLDSADLDDVTAVWFFDKRSPLQAVEHALKYGNRPSYGGWLGRKLGHHLAINGSDDFDVVTCIPLHPQRLLTRGYNQAAVVAREVGALVDQTFDEHLIARQRAPGAQTKLSEEGRKREVAALLDKPFDEHLIARQRATRTQTKLSREERKLNLAGAFAGTSSTSAIGQRVLLVDDVMTTGTTLATAAHTLKQAGAARVIGAATALARN